MMGTVDFYKLIKDHFLILIKKIKPFYTPPEAL